MKSSRDFVRLILFLIVGIGIYCFMGSALASQGKPAKPIIHMPAYTSYKVWGSVNKLEDSFYTPNKRLKELCISLRGLVRNYDQLPAMIEELIDARRKKDIELFAEKKEKIAQLLRPIWQSEQTRRAQLGFWGRLKEDFADKMNRLYKYFVSVKSK